MTTISIPHTASITIHAPLTIHILCAILTITSFITIVIDDGDAFIAAGSRLNVLLHLAHSPRSWNRESISRTEIPKTDGVRFDPQSTTLK